MRSMLLTCAVVLCLPTVGSSGQSQNVRIEPFPESPYLNATRTGLELHIDFIVSNDSARSLTVTRVELSVFGRDGRLAQRRFVSAANGGPNSGLLTIPRREIGPGGKLTLFNPFYLFDPDLEIGRAVFEFTLYRAGPDCDRGHPRERRAAVGSGSPQSPPVLPFLTVLVSLRQTSIVRRWE